MNLEIVSNNLALLLYGLALIYQGICFYRSINARKNLLIALCGAGAALHLLGALSLIYSEFGVNLRLYLSSSLVLAVTGLILTFSSLRKPAENLFLVLLPFSIVSLLVSLYAPMTTEASGSYTTGMTIHILLSICAYGVFILANANALLLWWENWQLRHKRAMGRARTLPPIETLENLLFEFIWAGELLLTAAIASGFLVFDSLFEQQLLHKTVFGLIAWIIYAVLLIGRHILGWRGVRAVTLSLFGFFALVLAYTGTKVVVELILQ